MHISGVRGGAAYFGSAPAATCVGSDALSGLAACTLSHDTSGIANGIAVTVTARATDRAGNVATARLRYRVLHFYLLDARYRNGAFTLHEGRSYTLVALTSGTRAPRYFNAVPAGHTPGPRGPLMNAAGTEAGLHRWTLSVTIDRRIGRYSSAVLGVKVGSTMHLVKFHPVS